MHAGKVLMQSILWRGLFYLSAFILNILLARHFEASVSGAVYYLISIYAMVVLVASLSLESGIIYFTAKHEIPPGHMFNFSLLWSVLVTALTFFITRYFFYEAYQLIPAPMLLLSAVCFITGNLLMTYCSGFFYANNNFIVPNCINIVITICLVIMIPYNGNSIVPGISDDNYFYFYFASFLLQGICLAVAARSMYIKGSMFNFISGDEFKMLFRYCAMAFAGNIIHFLLTRVDYWFVERYCSPGDLGNYIQVSKLGQMFFILPTILASAIFPMTASGKQTSIIRLLTLLSRLIFTGYFMVCLFLALAGKWLFPFVFGESFHEMYTPFLLLVPGILAFSGIFTITAYFSGKNMIRLNIIGSLLALAVILIGDILFIPKYGIAAAALVSSIGYIVYQLYVLVMINKQFPSTISDFFIFRPADLKNIKQVFLDRMHNED